MKVIVIVVCLSLTLIGCGRTQGDVDPTAVGVTQFPVDDRELAPEISGPSLDTGELTAVTPGAVTVVNAWASWCVPCLTEMPILIDAAAEYADDGVRFIGLNVQDEQLNASQFVEDLGITFDSIRDPDGALLATIPGVPPRALPSTIVIDEQGRIAARIIGPVEEQQLDSILNEVIAE